MVWLGSIKIRLEIHVLFDFLLVELVVVGLTLLAELQESDALLQQVCLIAFEVERRSHSEVLIAARQCVVAVRGRIVYMYDTTEFIAMYPSTLCL